MNSNIPINFLIRRAFVEDALGIHLAHMESIQKVCSSDHSPEEIKVWGHRVFKEDQRINAITNQIPNPSLTFSNPIF